MAWVSVEPAPKPAEAPRPQPQSTPKPTAKPVKASQPTPVPSTQAKPSPTPLLSSKQAAPSTSSFSAPPASKPAESAAASAEPAPPSPPAPAPVTPPTHKGGYLHNPQPPYPPASLELGEEGRVRLRVEVTADGRAASVEVAQSSGFPRLDRSALSAVRNWRFVPAKRGDEAISFTYTFAVDFSLKKQSQS